MYAGVPWAFMSVFLTSEIFASTQNFLTEEGENIMELWCLRFGITENYYKLLYLRIVLNHVRITPDWYDKVGELLFLLSQPIADHYDADPKVPVQLPFTVNEQQMLQDMVLMATHWCRSCLQRYQNTFYANQPSRGLQKCVELLKSCHLFLVACQDPSITQTDFLPYLESTMKAAIDARFQVCLQITATALETKQVSERKESQEITQRRSSVASEATVTRQSEFTTCVNFLYIIFVGSFDLC
jgi:hypothetical protein